MAAASNDNNNISSIWRIGLPLYIGWRMAWANRMPIMDCDEVFNYWEPLHFLQHQSGMQTWEYAPQYALRTYAYLWPLVLLSGLLETCLPSWLLLWVADNGLNTHRVRDEKAATFCVLRACLAGTMAFWEMRLLRALSEPVPFSESLSRQQPQISSTVALVTAIVLVTSTGTTHSSGALLPSSTMACLWLVCATAYVKKQYTLFCAVAVLATLGVGWPFGVVVFVPMALHIITTHQRPIRLLTATLLWTIFIQSIVMVLDHAQYGTWTLPTYNIFIYNAQHGGDERYGVEPASYYAKNIVLNLNYVGLLGLTFLPVAGVLRVLGKPVGTDLVVMVGGTLYPWLTLVVPRPHKEERFLFPIYPALCLGGVVVVDRLWRIVCAILRVMEEGDKAAAATRNKKMRPWWILLLIPSCLFSLGRSYALSKYYSAPTQIYNALPSNGQQQQQQLVCTCGEWHRFPSSYYLPENTRLGFLPSSFRGQLPKAFEKEGSRVGTNFNDQNKQEMDRYAASVDECDFVVELETSDSAECLVLMNQSEAEWNKIAEAPYLDASRTPMLHRTLYLPYLHEKAVERGSVRYISYSLYQAKVP